MESPRKNQCCDQRESLSQPVHGHWAKYGADAVELVMGEPKQGDRAESEGDGELRSSNGRSCQQGGAEHEVKGRTGKQGGQQSHRCSTAVGSRS